MVYTQKYVLVHLGAKIQQTIDSEREKKKQSFDTKHQVSMTLKKKPFERDHCGNHHFLLLSKCFLTFHEDIQSTEPNFMCCLKTPAIWESLPFFSYCGHIHRQTL